MGQALYRKYRSKSLDEILGQEQITTTISNALKQGRISHAYLFTGPRGVGKTSIARILAHQINDLPYTDDSSHIDIIEIDAASNRRIDEIRELRDRVYIAPTSAKYKVYIIDEVHMLTKEAFNALLKTLEEPPEHVVFILATTDAHKLPDTIVSRTQRFNFRPADKKEVIKHLQYIAKQENITATPEAFDLIAEHGDGSFRDSISLLDQASERGTTLEVETVQNMLGIPPTEMVDSILNTIKQGTASELISNLEILYSDGYQASSIAQEISQILRAQIVNNAAEVSEAKTLNLLKKLIEVPQSVDPERFLEIILLESQSNNPESRPRIIQEVQAPIVEELIAKNPAQKPKPKIQNTEPITTTEPADEVVAQSAQKQKPTLRSDLDDSTWPLILQALKAKHNTLYGVVRMAQPRFEADKLVLAFEFAFHEKRIKQNSNRQILADIIYETTGMVVAVDCILDKAASPPKLVVETIEPKPNENLTAISNIFGGGELIES